jgi:hypothetical protein
MYTSVRRYEGVSNPQEATRQIQAGFLPVISALPGFVGYQWIDLGHGSMLSISVFDNLANAIDSNHAAARWVAKNLPMLLAPAARIESGRVMVHGGKS